MVLVPFVLLIALGPDLSADPKLAVLDRQFVCPEALPDDAARSAALKQFFDQVGTAEPAVTIGDMIAYRLALLRKHDCRDTLANIARSQARVKP